MTPTASTEASTTAHVVEVRDLEVGYWAGDRCVAVVRGVNFDLRRGAKVGLVGESGCGKSLTARAIMRLLSAGLWCAGSISMDGVDLLGLNER